MESWLRNLLSSKKHAGIVMACFLVVIVVAGCAGGSNLGSSTPVPGGESIQSEVVLLLETTTLTQTKEMKFSVKGFLPAEKVVVNASGDGLDPAKLLVELVASQEGTLNDEVVTLPEWLTSGTRTLQVVGKTSGRKAEETVYIRAYELWMELGNFSIRPSEKVGFIGGGFEPEERIRVYLYHQSQQKPIDPTSETWADLAGNISWSEVNAPAAPAGEYTLLLEGERSSSKTQRGIVMVQLSPELDLQPYAGIPGTKLSFSGQGFLPEEKIHVYLGGRENEISVFEADEYGNFWNAGLFGVPQDAKAGTHSVSVTGEKSGVTVMRPFTVLALYPWLELSNYAGPAGSSIRFAGGGFAAGEKISVHAESRENPPLAIGKTNEEGNFWDVGPLGVPPGQNDKVTFIVFGEGSQTETRAAFQLLSRPTPGR